MRFLGNIEAKADNKGRIFVPASYRKQLEKEGDSSLVMRIDSVTKCAKFYPSKVWEELDRQFQEKLNLWDRNDMLLYRQFTAQVEPVELDSNGRILVSRKNADAIGISADVLFVGVGNHFELWDAQNFNNQLFSPEEFANAMQKKMGNPGAI